MTTINQNGKNNQASIGDNSPNIKGDSNTIKSWKFDRFSFGGGFLSGVVTSIIGSLLYSLFS